jgi:hypothetical protein
MSHAPCLYRSRMVLPAIALCALAGSAFGQNAEVEPNDSKATATIAASGGPGMATGQTITGVSISGVGTGLDYFRVKTASAPLGIYRHRLALSSTTPLQVGTIRGLTQTNGVIAPTSDVSVQTTSATTTPPRFVQWYGFGRQEEIYYRVTGNSDSPGTYTSTLETLPVTPLSGPTLPPGSIVISTIGQTTLDTDLWIYDSAFNAIPNAGNDEESVAGGGTGATAQSRLVRTLTPGTYYLAISRFNLANNQASPVDDDFRAGAVLDFPHAVACSSVSAPSTLNVSIGGTVVPINSTDPFGVQWVQFTVGDQLSGTCTSASVTEGTIFTLQVTPVPATGVPIASVFANAGALNASASNIELTDTDSDGVYTASIRVDTPGNNTMFAVPFTITDVNSDTFAGSCSITVLPTPTGGCCVGTSCSVVRQYQCFLQNGTFQGPGSDCGSAFYGTIASNLSYSSIATTGTRLLNSALASGTGDDGFWSVPLPFTFPFFATSFNQCFVSTNGLVTFGAGSQEFGNTTIPSPGAPNHFVTAAWDDYDVRTAGAIYTFHDTVLNRFIISWEGVRQFGVTDSNNFQVILSADGNVDLVYGGMTAITQPAPTASDTVTAGAENATGTQGTNVDTMQIGAGLTARRLAYSPPPSPCGAQCDSIDYNADGLFPDTLDIDDFLSVFSGGPCTNDPNCGGGTNDIDFNNDGLFPDTLDIDALLSVFSGGACL